MSLNDQIANLILEKGRAQAQGVLGSGQAWSGALSQIGQGVGSAIQQATDPRRQLEGLQVNEAQQRADDLKKMDAAFQQPGGRDAIIQALPGHLRPAVMKQFQEADTSAAQMQEAQLKAESLTNEYVNGLAETIKAHDYDPSATQLALSHAKTAFQNNPSLLSRVGQMEQALQAAPTSDTVKGIVDPILAAHEAQEKPVILPATPRGGSPAQLTKGGKVVATGLPAPAAPPTAESVALAASGVPDGQQPTPEQAQAAVGITQGPTLAAHAEAVRHNAAMEAIQKMQVGREAAANAETARHNKATEAAANPLAGMAGAPASANGQPANPTGDEVLKNLAPPIAAQVKALAEGRMNFPSGFALKSPYWQSMISLVSQYDPSFDATNYGNRAKTRADFSSGKSAQTINALNTVAQHLDRLSTSADGLDNSSLPAYNTIANLVSKATGNPAVTKFETDKKAVVDELTRAWRQAGGTESDIKSWSQVLDSSGSPAQLHTAIGEMGNLLEGKLSAMETQLKQGMGPATDLKAITPEARATLDKLKAKGEGAAGTVVPANVASVLKGAAPGKHTLSDGSVWTIASDGTITKGS